MTTIHHAGVVLILTACFGVQTYGDEPTKAKVTVEFRWIESVTIKGVTEDTGHPIVCGGDDWYAHRKPVLTGTDVASARLSTLNVGLGDQYGVEFTLTAGAVKKLAEGCGDERGRMLTVYVDGRWYGSSYFDKSKPQAFSPPTAGYMTSKTHAERILEASK